MFAIVRGANGRRHEVDFNEAPAPPAGQSTGAHRPAIKKQSYIRFATSFPGRLPNDIRRPPLAAVRC
jgi:hypothetical protein